jgi:uncharacterized protein
VWAQILYPNGIGFSSNHIFALQDKTQRLNILQVYNDFLVETQEESNGRLFPQALLPIWDMDETVAEMTRLLDRGIRGFTLSDKPEMLGLAELPDPYFTPMWDLFNESRAVVNFHINSGSRREDVEAVRGGMNKRQRTEGVNPSNTWSSFGRQRAMAVFSSQMYMSNARMVANFCMSDLFDRYPNLKIVSAESGIGWVPFMLEALEYQFDEMISDPIERGVQKRRPAEYFADHIYVMFWFEKIAAEKLIRDIGVKNVLVETDIPHPTCLYPNPREHFERVLSGLEPHEIQDVFQDNAAKLYNIDLPTPAHLL